MTSRPDGRVRIIAAATTCMRTGIALSLACVVTALALAAYCVTRFPIYKQSIWALCGIVVWFGCAEESRRDKGHDATTEKKVHRLVIEARKSKQRVLPIDSVTQMPTKSLCFQSPYINRKAFEALVGKDLISFEQIQDDAYVWWLFDERGSSRWILVPRVAVADRDNSVQQACFDLAEWNMVLDRRETFKYRMEKK